MYKLSRPVFRIPSPFTYTKRSEEGNSFSLITQGWAENLFINPATGISKYIELGMLGHNGQDYAVPRETPVYAAHDGIITRVYDANNSSPTKGYGVYNTHAEGWKTVYWHFLDVAVKEGQKVKDGDLIGYSDNTGMSLGDHLHFGLYPANPDNNNGYHGAINPLPYFSLEEIMGKQETMKVDNILLEKLYLLCFKRKPDPEAIFHEGKELYEVIDTLLKSKENEYYTRLFKEAKRIEKEL